MYMFMAVLFARTLTVNSYTNESLYSAEDHRLERINAKSFIHIYKERFLLVRRDLYSNYALQQYDKSISFVRLMPL